MLVNEYQIAAGKTAVYPARSQNVLYPLLGLAGELGELIDKVLAIMVKNPDLFEGGSGGHVYEILEDCAESLERAERLKKFIRDGADTEGYLTVARLLGTKIEENDHDGLCFEAGDLQWYVAQLAFELGVKLEDVCRWNLNKLESRQERNVLHGNGDNR
jgi:NTP pyrophosphatase (non-canonical NTP hydrolase)